MVQEIHDKECKKADMYDGSALNWVTTHNISIIYMLINVRILSQYLTSNSKNHTNHFYSNRSLKLIRHIYEDVLVALRLFKVYYGGVFFSLNIDRGIVNDVIIVSVISRLQMLPML